MVRLLPVRHRRGAGVRRAVLSEKRSCGRHAAGVPDLRRRLRGAAARRHPVRHHGRPLRAQARFGGDLADDRHRHHGDRPAADLCPDRLLGPGALGLAARRAGIGRRRRIWRRGDLPGGKCARKTSRLLGQFCAARRLRNLLAAGAFALVTLLPREDLMSWGWRLPFLASFLLIMVGIYVRLKITETPVFTEAVLARGKVERNPAMEALKRHPRNFFVVLGARLAENGLGYLFPVFGLSYVITTLGVPRSEALSALMLAFVIELFTIVGFATLSDRIGRRPVYMFGALAGIAWAFPFFWPVGTKEWIWIAVAFIGARAVVTAAMFGPQAAYFAELFPPQRRFAGFAFARELGSLLAGGPAPFVAAALVAWSGSWWPVACYAAGLSALTAIAIWAGPETYQESITVDHTSDGAMHAAAMPQRA